jgi:hypothetical protein
VISSEFQAAVFGLALGFCGAVIGSVTGAVAGIDHTLSFEGKQEADIRSALASLSKSARVRGIQ